MLKSWILLTSILLSTHASQAAEIEWYPEIKRLVKTLFRENTLTRAAYVTVGSSPIPVTTVIDAFENSEVHDLPLSSIRNLKENWDELPAKTQVKLSKLFDPILATKRDRIILIDYAASGRSLIRVQQLFNQYKRTQGIDTPVKSYAIIKDNAFHLIVKRLRDAGIRLLETNDKQLLSSLWAHHFRQVSPYNRFSANFHSQLRRSEVGEKRNVSFKKAVLKQVARDPDFRRYQVKRSRDCVPMIIRLFFDPALRY